MTALTDQPQAQKIDRHEMEIPLLILVALVSLALWILLLVSIIGILIERP